MTSATELLPGPHICGSAIGVTVALKGAEDPAEGTSADLGRVLANVSARSVVRNVHGLFGLVSDARKITPARHATDMSKERQGSDKTISHKIRYGVKGYQ